MTKTGGAMTTNTRGSYIEDDCKINAGIKEKEKILERIDEVENLLSKENISKEINRIKDIVAENNKEDSLETPGGSTPSQYQLPDNATDLQDLIEHREMNFAMGNIFKACYRSGNCSHSDAVRDINKVLWFAKREKKRLEKD